MQNKFEDGEDAMRRALAVNEDFQQDKSTQPLLRLLIDARKMRDGGIGVYTRNLVSGLLENGNAKLSLITRPNESLPSEWAGHVAQIEDKAKGYSFDELFGLTKRVDFSQYDLFHTPHYILPYRIPVPSVITVHDLIHVYHPERKYYPIIASRLIRSALKRATRILTVSEASRNEISNLVGARRSVMSKVRVIPNAIDPFFLAQRKKKALPSSPKVRHLAKYFVALFSTMKPHKGLLDLLYAFEAARERSTEEIHLVLVGQGMENIPKSEKILEKALSMPGVHILGKVGSVELAELYANALALIVPSLAEGFSLPVLEAQALGTPVVARPVPAIREIMTDNDVMSSDFSLEALSRSILKIVERFSKAENAIIFSQSDYQKHFKRFDRCDLAKTVMQVYREIVPTARIETVNSEEVGV